MDDTRKRSRYRPSPGEKTQREAIFEIIRDVLGDRFVEGSNAVELVRGTSRHAGLNHGYRGGGPVAYQTPELDEVIERIVQGIKRGSIKSKHRESSDKVIESFARRIINYWLTHDPRLNGGDRYLPKSRRTQWTYKPDDLANKLNSDPQIKATNELLSTLKDESDIHLVSVYIQLTKAILILKDAGIWDKLPEWLRNEIKSEEKKAA